MDLLRRRETPSQQHNLGLRRFWLTRGENKDHRHHTDADERANLLQRGTHYHDPFIRFLLFAISCWWHTNTTQRAGKFLTISACMFVSFVCVCASIPYWQRALCGARACGATLVACYTQATNTTRHTQQQVQSKELLRCWLSPKPTWSTGFSENHNFFEIIFIQQDVVSSLSYYNTQMIHNNTFLLAVKAGNA